MSKDLIVAILLLAAFLVFTAFRIYVNRKKKSCRACGHNCANCPVQITRKQLLP